MCKQGAQTPPQNKVLGLLSPNHDHHPLHTSHANRTPSRQGQGAHTPECQAQPKRRKAKPPAAPPTQQIQKKQGTFPNHTQPTHNHTGSASACARNENEGISRSEAGCDCTATCDGMQRWIRATNSAQLISHTIASSDQSASTAQQSSVAVSHKCTAT